MLLNWVYNKNTCAKTLKTYSSGTSGHGFIIAAGFIAKRHVVHATLRGGAGTKGAQNGVDQTL